MNSLIPYFVTSDPGLPLWPKRVRMKMDKLIAWRNKKDLKDLSNSANALCRGRKRVPVYPSIRSIFSHFKLDSEKTGLNAQTIRGDGKREKRCGPNNERESFKLRILFVTGLINIKCPEKHGQVKTPDSSPIIFWMQRVPIKMPLKYFSTERMFFFPSAMSVHYVRCDAESQGY